MYIVYIGQGIVGIQGSVLGAYVFKTGALYQFFFLYVSSYVAAGPICNLIFGISFYDELLHIC